MDTKRRILFFFCGLMAATLLWAGARNGADLEKKAKSGRLPRSEAAFHPAPLSAGGPDAFGYRYMDSDEPGGPAFQWVDISETGTSLSLNGYDDDYVFPVEIGFPFTFYGQTFTEAAVGTNGHVYFQDDYLGYGNDCIPADTGYSVTENFIAAYWNDLVIYPGEVYVQTLGTPGSRRFVVQFQDVQFYGCGGDGPVSATLAPTALSFEVILHEADGSILLQYLQPAMGCSGYDNGADATIGIQRDPSLGLQYSCFEPSLQPGLAILFTLTPPFAPDVTFLDDLGRAELCIQRSNGAYQWTNRDGSTYQGTLVVANGGTAFWTNPGDPTYIYATYDARRKRARAYFSNSEDGNYNSLSDRNTTNNPACGSLGGEPVTAPPQR